MTCHVLFNNYQLSICQYSCKIRAYNFALYMPFIMSFKVTFLLESMWYFNFYVEYVHLSTVCPKEL